MTEQLGFALIGCGRIAQKYSEIFASDQFRGGRIVAVCDVKKERAEKLAGAHDVVAYADFHEMMDKQLNELSLLLLILLIMNL